MSVTDSLIKIQQQNNSMICLGLDLDPKRMPEDFIRSPRDMFQFAYEIIEATKDIVCAYKPNMAFFESMGPEGLSLLKVIIERIPEDIPVILDGKRGDIGNTAGHYAMALFERYGATWVTVNPYMGYDSLRPFLEYKDKGIFILCLTSNNGAKDFQMLMVDGKPLYEIVAEKVAFWNKEGNCGLVVGATQPEQLKEIRDISDNMPILIPGVGAQGGSLELAAKYGTANFTKPAVINVSRSVLYASTGDDYAKQAREEVLKLNSAIKAVKDGKQIPQTNQQPAQNEQPNKSNLVVVSDVPKDTEQKQEIKPAEPKTQEQPKQFEQPKPQEPSKPYEQPKRQENQKPLEQPRPSEQSRSNEQPKPQDQSHQFEQTQSHNYNKPADSPETPRPQPRPLPTPPPLPKPPSTLPFSNAPSTGKPPADDNSKKN